MTENALRREGQTFLRGFGQIMLQESALTGLLFLVGILANSLMMFGGALLGALSGLLTAKLFRYDAVDVNRGFYGFNGALVGIALFFFHEPGFTPVALTVVGAAISAVIMRTMLNWAERLPPYTAPFVVAAWLVLFVASQLGISPNDLASESIGDGEFYAVARGVGQVMFQGYWISGVLFVVGLYLHSRNAAGWALIGSALGIVTARGLGYPEELTAAGIYGFNASLAGIALASKFRENAIVPLAGIIVSVIITRLFQLTPVPPLTAPFVLATWLVTMATWLKGTRTGGA